MKIRLNKVTIILSIFFAYVLITTYFLRGESYIIESSEPIEDIVVICHWPSSAFSNLHSGGSHVTKRKGMVVKSSERFSCGFNWFSGLTLSRPTYNYFRHPTHAFEFVQTREDDVNILKSISKLEQLDELARKFNLGEKNISTELDYARAAGRICGFPYQYLEYYMGVNDVIDIERFKKVYDKDMFLCIDRMYEINKKYSRSSPKNSDARETMDIQWENIQKGKFK